MNLRGGMSRRELTTVNTNSAPRIALAACTDALMATHVPAAIHGRTPEPVAKPDAVCDRCHVGKHDYSTRLYSGVGARGGLTLLRSVIADNRYEGTDVRGGGGLAECGKIWRPDEVLPE